MRNWFRMMAVVVAGLGIAPATKAETLTDAMIAAYRNSNLLDQNRAVLRAADEDVALAVSSLRPVVSYSAQAGWGKKDLTKTLTAEGLSSSLTLSSVTPRGPCATSNPCGIRGCGPPLTAEATPAASASPGRARSRCVPKSHALVSRPRPTIVPIITIRCVMTSSPASRQNVSCSSLQNCQR